MPGNSIAIHPDKKLSIKFTEEGHTYIDSKNQSYISVTTLIGKAFREFDSQAIAEKCAKRDNITVEELLNQWEEKRVNAAYSGTRLHENCENKILGNLDKLHNPRDIMEKIRFDAAFKIIDNIKSKYKPISMEPEKLIFSPDFGIAGSIDLLVKLSDLAYIIFDWKVLSKDLSKTGFNNECGCILPTLNIQHSNYWHYALQLQIYENILKSENYVNPLAKFKRCLLVWNGQKFHIEKMPNMPEAWALMAWKNKLFKNEN